MSVPEILWRVEQRCLQIREEIRFREKRPVTEEVFDRSGRTPDGQPLPLSPEKLFLNTQNRDFALRVSIPLPFPYRYENYRMWWHAGYQTTGEWPLVPSTKLDYRGMDRIGDARTNWELNKHFQFALLAKDYLASDDREWFLSELTTLFDDWNEKNPFLWGISWTSAIEIAERCLNWCLSYGFLTAAKSVPEELLIRFRNGILNMAGYLDRHHSRYSSANNHLIIEISALLHAGILAGQKRWTDKAIAILDRELFRQVYEDGVNKEEALYYQAFMMEAYALDLRLLTRNGLAGERTARWIPLLIRMTRYVRDCIGNYGEAVEFGDNDGGKLMDLQGGERRSDYYGYILQLMSLLLPERYVLSTEDPDFEWHENVCWLFTEQERAAVSDKPVYAPEGSVDYRTGGNAILRTKDGSVLIGIDHAPLGFGSLCAHGHADALSFQAFFCGEPLFCDPGTYIYHTDEAARDDFRSTRRHNTVCVNGLDQSEMLGAFLWGKKANCRLISWETDPERDELEAEHDGYRPCIHRRKFIFDKKNRELTIEDRVPGAKDAFFSLLLSDDVAAREIEGEKGFRWQCENLLTGVIMATVEFREGFAEKPKLIERVISRRYGARAMTGGFKAAIRGEKAVTVIRFGDNAEKVIRFPDRTGE